jgi:hypothetical protein
MPVKDIYYSDKYFDEKYEYRHVMLPKDIAKLVPILPLLPKTFFATFNQYILAGQFFAYILSQVFEECL